MRVAAFVSVGLFTGLGVLVACGSSSEDTSNGTNSAGSNSGGMSADAGDNNPGGSSSGGSSNGGTSSGGASNDAGGEDNPGGASNGGSDDDAGGDPVADGGGSDPQYGTPEVSDGVWDCSGESAISCSCAHFPGVDPIDGVPNQCLNEWSCCYAALGRVPATVDWRCICENMSESECTDTIEELNTEASPYSEAVRVETCPPQ